MYTALLLESTLFGFSIGEVLLHMLNLIILVTGLYFLLYKPVKNIVITRRQEYEQAEAKKAEMLREVAEFEADRKSIIEKAREEEKRIIEDAVIRAEQESKAIIDEAKLEAQKLLEKTNKEAKAQKAKLHEQLSDAVTDLAVKMASKILQREITPEDNDEIIKSILNDWKE